jgi:hypothetical protein
MVGQGRRVRQGLASGSPGTFAQFVCKRMIMFAGEVVV